MAPSDVISPTAIHLGNEPESRLPHPTSLRYFGPQVIHLLQSIENWRPRTVRELFIPGYSARLEWWVAMFALFFGIISILGLVVCGYQAYLSKRQLAVALKQLNAK